MRYGEPSIADALARLAARGVSRITVFPLYPQYSGAATESSIEAVRDVAAEAGIAIPLDIVPAFFDHPRFLEASVEAIAPTLQEANAERTVFSFHGLPERQVRKADTSGSHCFATPDCCDDESALHFCYRAQCLATTRLLGEALVIPEEERVPAFQSRFGRDRWIKPHTDRELARLGEEGVRRVAVITPAFVADCLETLEEIGIRGAATFEEHGGDQLTLAPCLNTIEIWADGVVEIASETTPALDGS